VCFDHENGEGEDDKRRAAMKLKRHGEKISLDYSCIYNYDGVKHSRPLFCCVMSGRFSALR
jgi:hypothetical protein